jgi:hypothetical protein
MIVDEPGIGGGVIDFLRAINHPVRPYDGGKPMVKGVDPEDECRMFANKRARDWWHLRRKLEQNLLPLPTDETMVNQLASLKYTTTGRRRSSSRASRTSRTGSARKHPPTAAT